MNILTSMYHEMGRFAFLSGEPFNQNESFAWKQGWKAAQHQNMQEVPA